MVYRNKWYFAQSFNLNTEEDIFYWNTLFYNEKYQE
jgi:hypothetical protein